MKVLTFSKGIHPPQAKETAQDETIILLPNRGDILVYPMHQHIGAPCQPLVKIGDTVQVGQKIGDSEAYVSAPVHSSVSGRVVDIRPMLLPTGSTSTSVFVENDAYMYEAPTINRPVNYRKASREELLSVIREAGIVGLGGAGFPTHVKLNPPPGKKVDTIIVNVAECEPYLTTDHRVLLEETEKIVKGLMVVLSLFPEAKGYIGVETNKENGIQAIEQVLNSDERYSKAITIARLEPKYPQGAEKQLIYSITKREVPSGGLPADVGCIVNNVDTVIAIHRAIYRGRPLMRKIMTVSGHGTKNPGNYKVRLGMLYSDMMKAIGGFKDGDFTPRKLIAGGPMMGNAMFSLDVPMTKVSQAFLAFTEEEAKLPIERNCIRCGRCIEVCPAHLIPMDLNKYILFDAVDKFKATGGMDCIECGCCSYVCPANRWLAQSIRAQRRVILSAR